MIHMINIKDSFISSSILIFMFFNMSVSCLNILHIYSAYIAETRFDLCKVYNFYLPAFGTVVDL